MRIFAGTATRVWLSIVAIVLVTSCGDDSIRPDQSLDALVGSWDAIKMVVVNKANPSIAPDLISVGATFFLDVQPSGQYTAILTILGQPSTEFGRVEVEGDRFTLHREQPGPPRSDVGTYRISRDTLFLAADTDFDFNFDGVPEPARILTDLKKRP
jgi:hypothetical protein